MHKRLTFWLALAGLAFATSLVLKLRKTEPPPAPVVPPPSAPYAKSIGARGIIESVDENIRISPAVAGLVARVLVKAGDQMKEGDPLVELDSRDAKAAVEWQQAQLSTLKAQLKETEVQLADKRDQWARIEKLSTTNVTSVEEKQRALYAAQTAESRLESMRAGAAASDAALNRSRVQLDLLTIRAPRPGRVLQVNVRPGEFASLTSPEPILLLGQDTHLQLRADVDEDNASRVRPGCDARAYVKGRRDIDVPLKFHRIGPYIVPKRSLSGESNERVDTRVLQVIFRFDRPSVPVYVGQQMDVFIDAESGEGAAGGK